jgi:uncharacterized protein YegP (UPF0339 family)
MYFTIQKDGDGWRARAFGANHELVWLTEAYAERGGAANAIEMLKSGAADAPVQDS